MKSRTLFAVPEPAAPLPESTPAERAVVAAAGPVDPIGLAELMVLAE